MRTLIIYESVHHKNTKKIAKAMAETLNARLVAVGEVSEASIWKYDLIGFGSGIYFRKHHQGLLSFVENTEHQNGRKAFIFSTSGMRRIPLLNDFNKELRKRLLAKGFEIVDEFNCRGWDTYPLFVRHFGGICKGRPNKNDIEKAKRFAEGLKG